MPSDLDLAAKIVHSPHAALKTRGDRNILVLPERAIQLHGSSAEILRLCEQPRTGSELLATMRSRYPGDPQIDEDVSTFLTDMIARGALELHSQRLPRNRPASPVASRASDESNPATTAPTPLNLIAELTYRCPLQCPYCSNPLDLSTHRASLSAQDWGRVFDQAAALGVVHVGLTGGEPSTRRDLEEILERATNADLYSHLVTAGLPLDGNRLEGLARRGLRSVQISIQDAEAESSDRFAGTQSFDKKIALCERTSELGLALTLNCVLHRHNLESVPALIELARLLKADRLELANTQYHGWALRNRAALMPTRDQLREARRVAREAASLPGGPQIIFVLPDYYSERPKPCMGGWGKLALVIDPEGNALPCHGASDIPGLEFWNVKAKSLAECWLHSPGMNAFRGTDWMSEPCQSCPERENDFGGCRCQAFRLLGDARRTDPACALSSDHERVIVSARRESVEEWVPRR